MSTVVERCPLCGRSTFELFERQRKADGELTYVLCRTCGMVVQSPRMSDEELGAFYVAGYRQTVQATEAPTDKDLRVQAGRARHLVRLCRSVVPEITRHLDIGSSSGALLRAFRRAYGAQGIGIEPGAGYRQEALRQATETLASLDEIDPAHRNGFDLISVIHLLEHIPDPVDYLLALREKWLAPHGWLLVEVPNLFGHRGTELSHLSIFSPRTLRQTLDLAGFRVIRLRAHGAPRSPVLQLYLTAIARARLHSKLPHRFRFASRGTRFRRRLGMMLYDWWTVHFPNWAWQEFPAPEDGDG